MEEQFYLVWPLIVYRCGRERTLQIAIGASLFSLVLRFVLFAAGVNPLLILTNIFTRLDSLMIGAACACLMQDNGFVDWLRRHLQWGWIAPFIVFPILRLAGGTFHNTDPVLVTAGYTAIDVACACVLMAVVLSVGSRTPLQRFFTSPALRTLGKYSYAAYIWHVFVRVVVLWLEERVLHLYVPWYVNIPLMIAITLGVSMLTYIVIEQPFVSLKRYFEPVSRAMAAQSF